MDNDDKILPLVLMSGMVGEVKSMPPNRSSRSVVVVEFVVLLLIILCDVGGMMSSGPSLSTSKSNSAFCTRKKQTKQYV